MTTAAASKETAQRSAAGRPANRLAEAAGDGRAPLGPFPRPPEVDLHRPGVTPVAEPPEGVVALLLAHWARAAGPRGLIHAARSETRAERLARAVRGFAPEVEVLVLPPWDCLPYDRASPSRGVMGRRIAALRRLAGEPPPEAGRLVVTTVDALVQRVPPRAAWGDAAYRIEVGGALPIDDLRTYLLRAGYVIDERVDEPGEAAIRGEVIDLFPGDTEHPYRLDLADDGRVAAIRCYDPVSQRTISTVEALELEPASEVLLDAAAVEGFGGKEQAAAGNGAGNGGATAAAVLTGPPEAPRRVTGSEHRLALFYDSLETVFDYLPGAPLALDPAVEERRAAWLEQVADAYEGRRSLQTAERMGRLPAFTPLEPERLYLDEAAWRERPGGRAVIDLGVKGGADLGATPVPRFVERRDPRRALSEYVGARLADGDWVVLAAADAPERRRLVRAVERRVRAPIGRVEGWAEVAGLAPGTVASAELDLAAGFALPGGLAVIAAGDVHGERAQLAHAAGVAPGDGVLAAVELRPGDIVVHIDHGIGVLRGLETLDEAGVPHACLALEYHGGAKLLVPVEELDRLWRYGSEEAEVGLDRLDGEGWAKRRAEVEAQLAAAAAALVELARRRERAGAPKLVPPRDAYARFAARFPFAETADQARAIEAALGDLASGRLMDRLVCGDVGFGKTEVALRAAAAVALSGKQVAVVAPTTVLVRQHLETFRRRFAGFGVRVEQLSRLAASGEARGTRDGIADGTVRIAIGTHALASEKVRFHDLGLVVIDEEQRFGARHKERLRALKRGAHVLTMTATPIPRTLQSALVGIQDLSVIATPPVRRQPVRTFVLPSDPVVVREALRRERQRGGQGFFVCPRIADLEPMAGRLRAIAPDLDVVVAHGRMKADALDELMVAFADGAHDVLLTTAIIEAGLDIPAANTMLVWRPDRFGLAQLHQLRGRVGRGRQRAATYLLTDPEAPLPPATEQRLRTLEALEGLGAGFAIGARDLDLRGAGDLLGADQAGHVRLIGTGLYQHMLERAVRRARGDGVPDDWSPEVHLGVPVVIPEDYVPEPEVRLGLYERLAELESEADVAEFAEEVADRFGPLPDEVRHLLALAAIRQRCRRAGVARVEAGPKGIALRFREPGGPGRRFAALIERSGGKLAWREDRLVARVAAESAGRRIRIVERLLERLERVAGAGRSHAEDGVRASQPERAAARA